MSKRSQFTTITPLPSGITREVVLDFLHDHEEMIDLNPLVKERHPIPAPPHAPLDEQDCKWYSLTDKITYLPGGLAQGDITYTCAFHDLAEGLQTHCYAPAGLTIRDKWTVGGTAPGEIPKPAELGLNVPPTGLYLREDVNMKCNVFMTAFVKKTLKKSHAALVDRLKIKAEIASSNILPSKSKSTPTAARPISPAAPSPDSSVLSTPPSVYSAQSSPLWSPSATNSSSTVTSPQMPMRSPLQLPPLHAVSKSIPGYRQSPPYPSSPTAGATSKARPVSLLPMPSSNPASAFYQPPTQTTGDNNNINHIISPPPPPETPFLSRPPTELGQGRYPDQQQHPKKRHQHQQSCPLPCQQPRTGNLELRDREVAQSLVPDALRVPLDNEKAGRRMSEEELWGALGGQGLGGRTWSRPGSGTGSGSSRSMSIGGKGGEYVYSGLEGSEYGRLSGGREIPVMSTGSGMNFGGDKGSGNNGISGGLDARGHPEYPVMNPYDDGWWKN